MCSSDLGVHAALYGAWKDSPHEDFKLVRFVRELAFAAVAGWTLNEVNRRIGASPSAFVFVLTVFTASRIATEFYKLFVRLEPQDDYRIPTQVHWLAHVVTGRVLRLTLGVGWLAAIYGLYALMRLFRDDLTSHVTGPAAGVLFGSCLAVGGAYKDGYIEGFQWHKFFKSPISAAIGGLVVSCHTEQLEFVVLGMIALERMFNEFFHKIIRPGYAPGKFKGLSPRFPDWVARRKVFLVPYVATWFVIIWLWVSPLWPA